MIKRAIISVPDDLVNRVASLIDFSFGQTVYYNRLCHIFIGTNTITKKECIIVQIEEDSNLHDPKIYVDNIQLLTKLRNPFLMQPTGFTVTYPFAMMTDITDKRLLAAILRNNSVRLRGTQKTIISICISNALQFLHKRSVTVSCLTPDVIYCSSLLGYINLSEIQSRNPPIWRAPELDDEAEPTSSSDIFLFGCVLYELLTGKIPFDGIPENRIRKLLHEKKRPSIPADIPNGLRDLIKRCWAQSPATRPTDDELIREFESGNVYFPGTDPNKLQGFIDRIKEKRRQRHHPHSPLNIKNNGSPVKPSDVDKPFLRSLRLKSDNYYQILRNLESYVEPGDYEPLYYILSSQVTADTPRELSRNIMISIFRTLNSSEAFFAFIKTKMLLTLPYDDEKQLTEIFDILNVIFVNIPEGIPADFNRRLEMLTRKNPDQAVVLFAHYSKHFEDVKDPYPILDVLLKCSSVYLKSKTGREYISILYFLSISFEKFRRDRFPSVRPVLCAFMRSEDVNAAKAAYSFAFQMYDTRFQIPLEQVVADINDTEISPIAVALLLKMKTVPYNAEMINVLLILAHTRCDALLLLLKIAESRDGAGMIVSRPLWVSAQIPTLKDTLRLLLSVLSHRSLRQQVASLEELPTFLSKIAAAYEKEVRICVYTVVKNSGITESIFPQLSREGFFASLFRTVVEDGDDGLREVTLQCIEELARIGFTREFVEGCESIAPLVRSRHQGISRHVFFALYALSFHERCARRLSQINVQEDLGMGSLSNVPSELMRSFLKNIQ